MYSLIILALVSYVIAEIPLNSYKYPEIPGKYVVKFNTEQWSMANMRIKALLTFKPDYEYNMEGFKGFAGTLLPEEVQAIGASELVEYIETDAVMRSSALVKQEDAPWGLARISSRQPDSTVYIYDDSAGEGVCAYILDTGIDVEHPDFEGRATLLADFSNEDNLFDGEGHGTHTAGTVGSKIYGVAKKTKLFSVKVLDSDGSGTISGIVKGFEYAALDAKNRTSECPKGYVANVSLGGYARQAVNDAAAEMVKAGIFVAVSAGNSYDDAVRYSPASEPSVCTVGATEKNDTMPEWSNYGELVDILAPGVDIVSTSLNGSYEMLSGTSMSAPHVAGLGAYLLSLGAAEVGTICEAIRDLATEDAILYVPKDTANLLAFNGVMDPMAMAGPE